MRGRANPGDVDRLLLNTAEQDGTRVCIGFGQDPGQAGRGARHFTNSEAVMDHNKAEMGYFGLEYAGFWVFPLGRTKPYADNCDFMNARHHTFLERL